MILNTPDCSHGLIYIPYITAWVDGGLQFHNKRFTLRFNINAYNGLILIVLNSNLFREGKW